MKRGSIILKMAKYSFHQFGDIYIDEIHKMSGISKFDLRAIFQALLIEYRDVLPFDRESDFESPETASKFSDSTPFYPSLFEIKDPSKGGK